MVVPFLSCIVILLATFGYDMWENRYEIKGTEVNLSEYKPFHSYKIATLNKESQFQIKDELVRLMVLLPYIRSMHPLYKRFILRMSMIHTLVKSLAAQQHLPPMNVY